MKAVSYREQDAVVKSQIITCHHMHINKTVVSDKGVRGGLTVPGKTRISGSERNAESQKKHLQQGDDVALCSPSGATQGMGSSRSTGSIPWPRCFPSLRVSLGPALHAVPEHPSPPFPSIPPRCWVPQVFLRTCPMAMPACGSVHQS